MNAEERRKLYRQESAQRHAERTAEKDDSGRYRDIFDPRKKAGVVFWKDSQDDHEIYIVPHVTGKQHPRLPAGKMAIGFDPFVHRGIGVNEDNYICLNRTYKERCPICEYQARLKEDGDVDEKEIKALNPSRRSVYNIICLDTPAEKSKGVQVWEVSHFKFTVPLEEIAQGKKGGGNVPYGDIDEGKVISFRRKGKGLTLEYAAFELKPREPIPDAFLEAAVCLDELAHKPTYEEVHAAFYAALEKEESVSKEEETEKPTGGIQEKKAEPVPASAPAPAPAPAALAPAANAPVAQECELGAVFGTDFDQYTECKTACEPAIRSACLAKSCEIKGTFGTQFNQKEECRECPSRRPCRAKLDEIEEAASRTTPNPPPAPSTEKKKLTRRAV